jgi:hypothetical protein
LIPGWKRRRRAPSTAPPSRSHSGQRGADGGAGVDGRFSSLFILFGEPGRAGVDLWAILMP